jgi:hypothetical protein
MRDGWQEEQPDNWLRRPDPWEVARPEECVEVKLGCSFALREGRPQLIPNLPSTLIGIPFDRPVVGYGGKTVNTLRLWGAAAADFFNFKRFSGGEFVAALAETLTAETLTRCCTRTTPRFAGGNCASCKSTFSSRARLPISYAGFVRAIAIGRRFLRRWPSSSTILTRRSRRRN